ncbi:glycoside hydrolase family 15 protein [Agromyces badenianii]|uniref:glycoside hydrolase family 15 protein n=1 Tax=Agromyces badenianii TaxID=2080742 RepID=UPI000D58FF27|nr:glycoside hydrolase family 15 protein [Agromyces badenianii]PWC05355.1 glycoside hydrolase family 15 [Agromyces badenianii]
MTLPQTDQPRSIAEFAESSADLIERLQHAGGAYPASPSFSAYAGYSWFRDGAFIADGMSSYGRIGSAERFFDWCSVVLDARSGQLEAIVAAARAGHPLPDAAMLPTRFMFDGTAGDDEWWDFQLDGYGTWLWAVGEHARRHGTDAARWSRAIGLSVDYLVSSWRRPCFDWWEEHAMHVHVSTLGCIAAGLREAIALGVLDAGREAAAADAEAAILELMHTDGLADGHLSKWLGSRAVDASLASVVGLLGVVPGDSEPGRATIAAIERELTVDGGVHRYVDDTFYGGGQWPLLSCMLGIAEVRSGNRDRARELLDWAVATAGADGALPEQVGRHLLAPERVDEWVERWGPVAQPLLWSHAMVIRLAVELATADAGASEAEARA